MTEFPPQLPHGDLQEVLPDVFFVSGESRPNFNGQSFQFSRNMTVVREDDRLTLINTLRMNEEGLSRLDALGKVTNIVKLGSFHGRDDAFYLDRYSAKFWAPSGMEHERGVTATDELGPNGLLPLSDASVFDFETSTVPEVILRLDRHGGILISCDSLQNWTSPDAYFNEASAEMMKKIGFFGPANIGPGWRRAANPERVDFERLRDLRFRHLLSAHGEPLLDTAHDAVCRTIDAAFPVAE